MSHETSTNIHSSSHILPTPNNNPHNTLPNLEGSGITYHSEITHKIKLIMKINTGDYLVILERPRTYSSSRATTVYGEDNGLDKVIYPYFLKVIFYREASDYIHFADGTYGWSYREGYPIQHCTEREFKTGKKNITLFKKRRAKERLRDEVIKQSEITHKINTISI